MLNDYDKDVFNGDIGLVRAVDAEAGDLVVDFDGREVAYDFGELDELVLAYATTIHKSQGSEYPAVVIPVTTQHYPMLQRTFALHRRDPRAKAGGAGQHSPTQWRSRSRGGRSGGGGPSCGSGWPRSRPPSCGRRGLAEGQHGRAGAP